MPKKFHEFQEFSIFREFGHNAGTRNAGKSNKPSRDLYDCLEANKNSSQKNDS